MVHVYDDGEAADRVPSVDRVSKDLEDFCSSSRRNAPATASGGSNLRITQCDAMGDDDSEAAAATQRSNPDPKRHKMTARKSTNGIAPPRRQLATWTPAQMEHMRRGGKIHVETRVFPRTSVSTLLWRGVNAYPSSAKRTRRLKVAGADHSQDDHHGHQSPYEVHRRERR